MVRNFSTQIGTVRKNGGNKDVDLNDLKSELIIRDYNIIREKKSTAKVLFPPTKAPHLYRVDSQLKSIHDFIF